MHRALERAFTRPLGALPRLPSYLPRDVRPECSIFRIRYSKLVVYLCLIFVSWFEDIGASC